MEIRNIFQNLFFLFEKRVLLNKLNNKKNGQCLLVSYNAFQTIKYQQKSLSGLQNF